MLLFALRPNGSGSLRRADDIPIQLLCRYAGADYDRQHRTALRAGSELDAAMADPRWQASQL